MLGKRARGRPAGRVYPVRLTINVTENIIEVLDHLADRRRESRSAVAREALALGVVALGDRARQPSSAAVSPQRDSLKVGAE